MLTREEIERVAGEGREAFELGMTLDDCEYPPTSQERLTWLRGFQNAKFGASMLAASGETFD